MATSTIPQVFLVDTFRMPAFEVTAGTPGTYVTTLECNIEKTGYTPIACSLQLVGHPGTYLGVPAMRENKVSVHIFRSSNWNGSYNSGDVQVIVIYRKT